MKSYRIKNEDGWGDDYLDGLYTIPRIFGDYYKAAFYSPLRKLQGIIKYDNQSFIAQRLEIRINNLNVSL